MPDDVRDRSAVIAEIREGLHRRPPSLSPKFFYHGDGPRLFEAITRLPGYYLTETEIAILRSRQADIARRIGPRAVLVELGAGSPTKARIVLEGLDSPAAYVPVDIAEETLVEPSAAIRRQWPDLPVIPVAADLERDFALPEFDFEYRRTAVLYAGSTIGNLEPEEAAALLGRLARAAGPEARLVLGVDRKKDRETIERAYNDPGGVCAAFHRNILTNVNMLADGDFVSGQWTHEARYREARGRLEGRLVSDRDQTVRVAGEVLHFRAGDAIHTGSAFKYAAEEIAALAAPWWLPLASFSDAAERFTVFVMGRPAGAPAGEPRRVPGV